MRLIPAIVTALVLAGCMGDIDNVDTGNHPDAGMTVQTARVLYTTNVHPITMRCNGSACHSLTGAAGGGVSRFSDSSPDNSYNAIVTSPLVVGSYNAQAGILVHIAAGHNGITYSPADLSAINAWLSKEAAERMGQPPAIDPVEVLKKWSGCMTIANFNTAQMAQKWGALATQTQQRCANCHEQGLYGMMISDTAQPFFDMISKHKDYLLKYFTVDGTGKVIINMASMTNAGVTLADHPRFDPTNNLAMPALQAFYMSTLANTACGPSTLVD